MIKTLRSQFDKNEKLHLKNTKEAKELTKFPKLSILVQTSDKMKGPLLNSY